jgi:ribonuclease HI
MQHDIIAVYADGGIIGRNPSFDGGTWAWCHINAAGERIKEDSGTVCSYGEAGFASQAVTNNYTEMLALVNGLAALPAGWSGTVYSDSNITLGRLFRGWKWTGIPKWLIERAELALKNLDLPNVKAVLLDGHPTKAQLAAGVGKRGNPVSEHNVWCDKECGRQADKYREDVYDNLPF